MKIEPKIRGFICTTSHPVGCEENVRQQIARVQRGGHIANGSKKALILGASTGYGLASRIALAFGCGADTLGVYLERPAEKGRTASPGFYQSRAVEAAAARAGLYHRSLNGDAFSEAIKRETVDILKRDLGKVDMVVYSLASPRRTHPRTGETFRSVLKPIGSPFTSKNLDVNSGTVGSITLEPASEQEVEHTVGVMGGEDWEMWLEALREGGVLAEGAATLAYSYLGPRLTYPVYRQGTIGTAKDHLERTAHRLDGKLKSLGGRAFVSVNKAVVTQSSSAIPVLPLYICLLFKVMKHKGLHEGYGDQMDRLFRDKFYGAPSVPLDAEGRIRLDDWELREDIQSEVESLWRQVDSANIRELADLEGYRRDFLQLFGFDLPGVDYSAEVDEALI